MSYPADYTRAYSFLGFAQGQGNFEFPGTPMDTELDNIGLTVDEINAFLERSFSPEGILKPGFSADTEDFSAAIVEAQAQASASAASAAAAASFSGSAQTAASNSAASAATSAAQATSATNSKNAAAASAAAALVSENAAAASAASMPAVVATQYLRGNAGGTAFESRTAAQTRTDLSLVVGTNVQAWDADLDAIAALTSAADKVPYATGAGAWALASFPAAGRALVNVTAAADQMPYATSSSAWAMTSVTAAARTVLDDTTTAAMLTTLGALPKAGGDMTGALTFSNGSNIINGALTGFATVVNGSSVTPQFQFLSASAISMSLARFAATASPPGLNFTKSRGASVATHGAVLANDQLAVISTAASDGTAMRGGPQVLAVATAGPTSTLAPGYWLFQTNDGTTTYSAAQLSETGDLRIGGTTSANNVIWQNRHIQLRSYTAGTLPAATTAGQIIYVSDGAAGYRIAVSDGATWRLANGQDASQAALNSQTGTTYTLALTDANRTVEMNNASANTLTVPLNATVAFPIGTEILLFQMGAGQTAIAATGGVTIRSASGNLKITGQYSTATLKKRATDEWVLYGSLVP